MPRDIGTGLYHYPDGTPGNPGQTIFSTRYNTFINDLTNTLNQPLPINMGGTGAASAATARTNIKAEVSGALVTNYDTQVWENGSFYSDAGATGAPVSDKPFWGLAYGIDANNIFLEARNGATVYTRAKVGGVWTNWSSNLTLISGDLIIDKTSPAIWLVKHGTTDAARIISQVVIGTNPGANRWQLDMGNPSAETGADVGSDFALYRYLDNGTVPSTASLWIQRSTGAVTLEETPLVLKSKNPSGPEIDFGDNTKFLRLTAGVFHIGSNANVVIDAGELTVKTSATTGVIRFTNDAQKYLNYDGLNFILNGGALLNYGVGIFSVATASTGTFYFGNSGTKYLSYDGSNFNLLGGPLYLSSTFGLKNRMYIDGINNTNSPTVTFRDENNVEHGYLFYDRAADEMTWQSWPSGTKIRVASWGMASSHDNCYRPAGGPWIAGSDARIKTVLGDYQHGLAEVLALHPVVYSYKGNDHFGKALPEDALSNHSAVIGKPFVGLVAQECEGAMPEMVSKVSGFIDGAAVDDLRTLDSGPLVYALVNAVKTLTARIEALEAAAATP